MNTYIHAKPRSHQSKPSMTFSRHLHRIEVKSACLSLVVCLTQQRRDLLLNQALRLAPTPHTALTSLLPDPQNAQPLLHTANSAPNAAAPSTRITHRILRAATALPRSRPLELLLLEWRRRMRYRCVVVARRWDGLAVVRCRAALALGLGRRDAVL
jgi:hypothetical protein